MRLSLVLGWAARYRNAAGPADTLVDGSRSVPGGESAEAFLVYLRLGSSRFCYLAADLPLKI